MIFDPYLPTGRKFSQEAVGRKNDNFYNIGAVKIV